MPMTRRTLKTAGWLAMASSCSSFPSSYASCQRDDGADPVTNAIQIGIQLVGMALFVAITLLCRRLLNARFGFHDADRSIDLMIMANVVAAIASVVALCFAPWKETLGVAALVIVVFQGIVQVRFGARLLRLQDDLDGMLRPFCYLNMATGVCIASIVLIVVGVVVSAISDLMLGTIFFHIAKLEREPDSPGTGAQP